MNLLLLVGGGLLLLLVGTLLGRFYVPDRRPLQRAAEEGRSYARSLIEVLEGNGDQAIREISEALKRNTRSAEAYFALGTLFRERGEHERAVRVHQAILMRRDLDKKSRLRVHYQLALDFLQAGFPRRAIKALELVVSQDKKNLAAWRRLTAVYEAAGQWERALLALRRLGKLSGEDTSAVQAHLLAEQAELALSGGELPLARRALRQALSAQPGSIHALFVLGRYQERQGNLAAAGKAWEKALRLAPELASLLAPALERAAFEQGKPEAFGRLLQELLDAQPDQAHLRLAYARWDAKRNPGRALASFSQLLAEVPSLVPAHRDVARLALEQGDPERIRHSLQDLLELLQKADRGFRCRQCGLAQPEMFWRCPRCQRWDSAGVAWGRRAGEALPPASRKLTVRGEQHRERLTPGQRST